MADSELHSNNSDILIQYYKQQFAEIYHLDTLDWRVALILFPTFGGFFAVLGYLNTINVTTNALLPSEFGAFRAFSVFLLFLAFYGMWTVARGQVWLKIRTELIKNIEKAMNVSKIWNTVVEESKLAVITGRRIPLFAIYLLLFYFSSTVVFADSIADWKALNYYGIAVTLISTTICYLIHWFYLRSSLNKKKFKTETKS